VIAMQYGFTFPADYDMDIIRQRIANRGAMLDGFKGLCFKSYLFTVRGTAGAEFNRYAPFYLWADSSGMHAFLSSSGFAGLVADFGRPQVRIWSVAEAFQSDSVRNARWATIGQSRIDEKDSLQAIKSGGNAQVQGAGEAPGTLARVKGFDPAAWTALDFRLWARMPKALEADTQCWELGYVALG